MLIVIREGWVIKRECLTLKLISMSEQMFPEISKENIERILPKNR